MPNWIPLTQGDLEDRKVAVLVDALRTQALQAGQTDPTSRMIQSVVNNIRRKIASCSSNQVDEDETTIPASLLDMAVDFVLADMKGRLEIELTVDERDALTNHRNDLNRIAACTDAIEQPDTSIAPETQVLSGSPMISTDRQAARRAARSG